MPESAMQLGEGISLIARDAHHNPAAVDGGICLLFAVGARPSVDDIDRLLTSPTDGYSQGKSAAHITSKHGAGQGWLELLASGLTFDLAGLAPSAGCDKPRASHFFGLPGEVADTAFEALAIYPGPHLADAKAMLPVIKVMAGLASFLAMKLEAQVVCWQPGGCWMDPNYFRRIVDAWRDGGAFPALGLTGIVRQDDGAVESDGLAYFIGHELRLDARRSEAPVAAVKLAVRVIDHLVRNGPVDNTMQLTGADGELLLAQTSGEGGIIRIKRQI